MLIAGLIVSVSYSCREKGGKYINQGEIHYNIDYISSTGKMADEFKPKTLVVSFKNDNILFEILSPIGNQGIVNIVNPEKKIYDTYINMIGVKYYYSGSPNERHPGFKSMEGLEIKRHLKRLQYVDMTVTMLKSHFHSTGIKFIISGTPMR